MRPYPTFSEFLSRRSAGEPSNPSPGAPVAERSLLSGMFKVVNPARPVLPTNTLRRLAAEVGLPETTLKNWINGREPKGAGGERYHRLEMANY
jgi:hypothetical protein